MSSTLKKLVGALLGTKLRNETAPDSTLTSTHVTDVTATVPMTTATATIPIDESEYTKYMLSSLWDGMVIATAKVSTTAIPTPISKAELIEPPNMPEFHSELRLPEDFIWGWAATAPQSEGAVDADNRGPSIWDTACHVVDGFLDGNETLDIANNHYYLYKQDILRLEALGVPYYSLTISWSRVFPFGNGSVNQDGLQHYIDLVDYMLEHNITPIVTLYHWDLPQTLQNWYGGFLDERIIEDFAEYARVVFKALAPNVKIWITMNEPQIFCNDYMSWPEDVPDEIFPIFNFTSPYERLYRCGHNALLAHATAVNIFREEIEPEFGEGMISFANSWDFTPPLTGSKNDRIASQRQLDFTAGWFGHPIYLGDYPKTMKDTLGDLLPELTDEQIALVNQSADFYAWDSYTGYPVRAIPFDEEEGGFDECITNMSHSSWPICIEEVMTVPGGWLVGSSSDPGTSNWLHNTPDLFRQGVMWSWNQFKPKAYFIPEFGFSVWRESKMSTAHARYDSERVSYLSDYLHQMLNLVNIDKVNLVGAIGWTMLDNVEWREGSAVRFGFQYVEPETLKRRFKKSAFFFRNFFVHHINKTESD
jgi:beta-glucosidase/6-phospho-beta-glucosidase/beta-galactosidase